MVHRVLYKSTQGNCTWEYLQCQWLYALLFIIVSLCSDSQKRSRMTEEASEQCTENLPAEKFDKKSTWGCYFPPIPLIFFLKHPPPGCVFPHSKLCCFFFLPLMLLFSPFTISCLQQSSAPCDVSTLSFPLQSGRISRCSGKDRSLEWNTQPFLWRWHILSAHRSPLGAAAADFDVVFISLRERRKAKEPAACAHLSEKSVSKMAQKGDNAAAELSCISEAWISSLWHISMTFNLTFNH